MPIENIQLEIGNRKSAMLLPTRFHHAGNLSLQRQLAKANTAQMKLAQISARPPAPFAAGVCPGRKLRLAVRFRD
jgi:hypothetical protein